MLCGVGPRGGSIDGHRLTGAALRRGASLLPVFFSASLLAGSGFPAWAQRYVPTADPKFPKIRFADSLLSANDHCLVSKSKLNLKVRPVYVNGVPMGFC